MRRGAPLEGTKPSRSRATPPNSQILAIILVNLYASKNSHSGKHLFFHFSIFV
jgi:hypothetical protein